jgi:hypothetical protein
MRNHLIKSLHAILSVVRSRVGGGIDSARSKGQATIITLALVQIRDSNCVGLSLAENALRQ